MQQTFEILSGIGSELNQTRKHHDFKVASAIRDKALWRVNVRFSENQRSSGLDESMEGADAWWPGVPIGGRAEVLIVDPTEDLVVLRHVQGPPPTSEKLIRIYPPIFLDPLRRVWSDGLWANQCIKRFQLLESAEHPTDLTRVNDNAFPNLRVRQREAFGLISYRDSFLWGPPGTGKTYTLGTLLACFLVQRPESRVLLLSTTNGAVDLALVAVDAALEKLGPAMAGIRRRCHRIGTRFDATRFESRKHLLPAPDEDTTKKLIELERERPDPENIQAYAEWKSKTEAIRARFREKALSLVREGRMLAMTTSRATFSFEDLKTAPRFDLIVFDEASQVSLAHTLGLLPLASQAIFTGDPNQISPVVTSSNPHSQKWLGRSVFDFMPRGDSRSCLLNEQSRMAPPICDLISKAYYNGELRVAETDAKDPVWHKAPSTKATRSLSSAHCQIIEIKAEARFWPQYMGWIRIESAEKIVQLVEELLAHQPPEQILVVTPFRAQCMSIRRNLKSRQIRRIRVTTAHRIQGQEEHTIIFDPVHGDCDFLKDEQAPRLLNVALSRAKARLVILLSEKDKENPWLAQIDSLVNGGTEPSINLVGRPICELIKDPRFPTSCVGQVITFRKLTAKVIGADGPYLKVVDLRTGQLQNISIPFLKTSCSSPSSPQEHDPTLGRHAEKKEAGKTPEVGPSGAVQAFAGTILGSGSQRRATTADDILGPRHLRGLPRASPSSHAGESWIGKRKVRRDTGPHGPDGAQEPSSDL
jgi:DNA replication ATP-dependent helicase Dna2